MGKNAPGASFCSQCKKRTGSLIVYKNRELCRECDQAMSLEEKLADSTPVAPDPEEAVDRGGTNVHPQATPEDHTESQGNQVNQSLDAAIKTLQDKIQRYQAAIQILETLKKEV